MASLRRLLGLPKRQRGHTDYNSGRLKADGLSVEHRNLGFLTEPSFERGWAASEVANAAGWNGRAPDVRWRAHIAVWAARHGLTLEGDFVEFGVHTALLSTTICHALDFTKVDKTFYLFDTFNGIPLDAVVGEERARAEAANAHYGDVYALTQATFQPFPNVRLVRGVLPQTIADVPLERIAYVSMDLNTADVEMQVIACIWGRITPGAVIVLDDYGFKGGEVQYARWNAFAASHGTAIATLPTGQGLLLKP